MIIIWWASSTSDESCTLTAGWYEFLESGIVWEVTAFHSETPKWAKAIVQEDVKTAREILPNYAPFIEGITQGWFDAIEEKGIVYAMGYLTREVLSSN